MGTYSWQNSYFASNWLVYTMDKANKNLNKNKKRLSGSVYHRLTNLSLMAQWLMYELAMVSCWINQIQNLGAQFQRIIHRNKDHKISEQDTLWFCPPV